MHTDRAFLALGLAVVGLAILAELGRHRVVDLRQRVIWDGTADWRGRRGSP